MCLFFYICFKKPNYWLFFYITFIMTSNWELVISTNIALSSITLVMRISLSSFMMSGEKSERFNGLNFERWQQNMLFDLTILNLEKFLLEKTSKLSNNELNFIIMIALDVWNHSDFMCKNYVLNIFSNTQYDVHSSIKTAKILWKTLGKKFKVEVVCMKNHSQ